MTTFYEVETEEIEPELVVCDDCGATGAVNLRLVTFGEESFLDVRPPEEDNLEFYNRGDEWRCANCSDGGSA